MTGKEISGIFAAFDPQLKVLSNERLFSGLSNDNFLVRTAQQAFLLKCYREHWPAQGLAAQTVFAQQQVCPNCKMNPMTGNYGSSINEEQRRLSWQMAHRARASAEAATRVRSLTRMGLDA